MGITVRVIREQRRASPRESLLPDDVVTNPTGNLEDELRFHNLHRDLMFLLLNSIFHRNLTSTLSILFHISYQPLSMVFAYFISY